MGPCTNAHELYTVRYHSIFNEASAIAEAINAVKLAHVCSIEITIVDDGFD